MASGIWRTIENTEITGNTDTVKVPVDIYVHMMDRLSKLDKIEAGDTDAQAQLRLMATGDELETVEIELRRTKIYGTLGLLIWVVAGLLCATAGFLGDIQPLMIPAGLLALTLPLGLGMLQAAMFKAQDRVRDRQVRYNRQLRETYLQ